MEKRESCTEMLENLQRHWDTLREHEASSRMRRMVEAGCREVAPYVVRHLHAKDPFRRCQSLTWLAELGCREYRQLFIDMHLNDPDMVVREMALSELDRLYHGERDRGILQLALMAYDDPRSSTSMRLTAAAVMMYQLGIPHDERGAPAWWNAEPEDLRHPSIERAVAETRQLLSRNPYG